MAQRWMRTGREGYTLMIRGQHTVGDHCDGSGHPVRRVKKERDGLGSDGFGVADARHDRLQLFATYHPSDSSR